MNNQITYKDIEQCHIMLGTQSASDFLMKRSIYKCVLNYGSGTIYQQKQTMQPLLCMKHRQH